MLLRYQTVLVFDTDIETCDENGMGLLVGKDEFEPKQPQLGPFRTVSDPQAFKRR